MPLIIRAQARLELEEARNWYDEQQAGLGSRLLQAVEKAFERIRAMPLAQPKIVQHFRHAKPAGFPYSIIYAVEDGDIVVYSFFHQSRRPRSWLNQ